jgi:hypothetical protein
MTAKYDPELQRRLRASNQRASYLDFLRAQPGQLPGTQAGGLLQRVGAGLSNRMDTSRRNDYINMVDQAGGLPAVASARRFLDRIAAEEMTPRQNTPNAMSRALNSIAGNVPRVGRRVVDLGENVIRGIGSGLF